MAPSASPARSSTRDDDHDASVSKRKAIGACARDHSRAYVGATRHHASTTRWMLAFAPAAATSASLAVFASSKPSSSQVFCNASSELKPRRAISLAKLFATEAAVYPFSLPNLRRSSTAAPLPRPACPHSASTLASTSPHRRSRARWSASSGQDSRVEVEVDDASSSSKFSSAATTLSGVSASARATPLDPSMDDPKANAPCLTV
mmetsp:Transcript_4379/g.16713  ORF Transcript_4379/g.16713 Transcript_4379/m.16713 type:complete len:205 (+) Transcript_4379:2910-3524(+)